VNAEDVDFAPRVAEERRHPPNDLGERSLPHVPRLVDQLSWYDQEQMLGVGGDVGLPQIAASRTGSIDDDSAP
jgi:hypothetical protein